MLRSLKEKEFDTARLKPLSAFGIPWPLMQAATKAILKPQSGAFTHIEGEEVPADIIDEQAQEYLKLTPEDFAYRLSENSGLRFREDPAAISHAALLWLRAGYQPW
ncbi:MAG: hypothetical protein J5U19_01800 [Candidatus Methanoperedens sp.]|nr:hypothetical protein [Candidatus Methanoperedens sp.]